MKKLGFFGRQVLIYALIFLAVILILISLAHSYVMNVSMEKAAVSQEQLASDVLAHVDSYLDQLLLIATQVAHDTEIVRIMEDIDTQDDDADGNYFEQHPEQKAYLEDLLNRHNAIKNPALSIDLYNAKGDYLSTNPGTHPPIGLDIPKWYPEFFQHAFVRDAREFIMMGPFSKLGDGQPLEDQLVYMMMPIKSRDGETFHGYVDVYQTLESLCQRLELDQETATDIYLFYEMDGEPGGQIYPDPNQLPFPEDQEGYYKTQLQSSYDWFVILMQNQSEFLAPYHQMLTYLYLGGLALFLFLLLCVYLLVRYTSRPILVLSSRIKAASLSAFPELPTGERSLNEVKELEQSVDHMLQRIKSSVELEQQAYLKALQAQMRPHFLYNCLSTISSLGVEADSPVIPQFCSHLAALLRYESSYENGRATLAEEMENVRNYLELMKIRYEDDLAYELDMDPDLNRLSLPRLTLQPLVENSFEHGFRSVEPPWRVTIRAFVKENHWTIQVCDNGAGFDEATRAKLLEQAEQLSQNLSENYAELKIGGLGLVSTIIRIRLMSCGSVDFDISANQPCGTIITLKGELA